MSRLFARIGLRSTVIVLSIVLTVLVLAVAILPSASVAGSIDNHPMNVWGYVYDSAGHKVANATVTVIMVAGYPVATKTANSSSQGYFSVWFAVGQWATGNTIWVFADYKGGSQVVNSTLIVDGASAYQWVNATLTYEIPQFGNMTGLLLTTGLVGVVAAGALVWRRKA